jgi:thymidylate synthase
VNIWNEDAYNYYKKVLKKNYIVGDGYSFEEYITTIKEQGTVGIVGIPSEKYKIGDCGKQYGWLWRNFQGLDVDDNGIHTVDQLKELIEGLKKNPMSRRHIITAWNPATLDDMALNACHAFVQWNCRPIDNTEKIKTHSKKLELPKYYIDCQMYQRSADVVLGVPYNIASYALLTEILAKICNMIPGDFVHTFGDVHIYENHMEAVDEQLQREPRELPTLIVEESLVIDLGEELDFTKIGTVNFELVNYNPHPKLNAETKLSTGLK